jgi:hypothetical protein
MQNLRITGKSQYSNTEEHWQKSKEPSANGKGSPAATQ